MPSTYSEYHKYKVDWKDPKDYSVIEEIGSGGYSEVYLWVKESKDGEEEEQWIIKILKPTLDLNILREIKILELLKDGPSIVRIIEAWKDDEDDSPWIVFKDSNMINLFEVREIITPDDIRIFMYKIFEAINYAHSKGIMHRDMKIKNILVNLSKKNLEIIDWGISEFYHPNFAYNTKISTKFYRAPELVVSYPYYDYSLDIWSIGVIFAELLLNKIPLLNPIGSLDYSGWK